MRYIIGVDIGGTNIKIGVFVEDLMINKSVIETPLEDEGSHIIPEICQVISELCSADDIIAIGVAVPGPVIGDIVLGAHNIGWGEIDVVSKMKEYFPNQTIVVLNDANAATIGEASFDVEDRDVVMMTLGTGIGGGIIIEGEMVVGVNGSAGELGHMKLYPFNGRKCSCGLDGCLEQYASATGVVKTAIEFREGKDTLLNKEDLTSKDIFDFAKAGDKVAIEVVDRYCYELAIGCANVANVINPDLIILGGGVSKAGNFMLEKVQKNFSTLAFYSALGTRIKLAQLGNDAGMFGCYFYAKKALKHAN